jgi:hypothetical protein
MSAIQMNDKENALSMGIATGITRKFETVMPPLFLIYYIYHIHKKTPIFILHHILGIASCMVAIYVSSQHCPSNVREMFINFEITTSLSLYSDHIMVKIIFFISFFYCRIYNEYLLNDPKTYEEFNVPIAYSYLLIHGFFLLNLYWFVGMIRKIRAFEEPIYKKYCHKIIPFIRPFNPSLLNFYSTISSYLYHQDMYDRNENEKSISPIPQEIVYSIVNSMVSISSIEPCYYKYSIPIHLCKYVGLNELVPIGVDVLFYNSSDALIIYYIVILFTYMKPFYNMNPLAIHILLIIMKY